ncbi:hypothetical protein G7Z17_g9319 [Cylindrodendrum hubeiense]|uniref:Uncharacterized protein n=1 Tax=Cylindrodendrum hubeiense TaxID=595255 RepID=A0A9P5LDT7_9HYPO|nr:hypothetical protein G7Z17_g9319 [Cylindrodendrum hubeiense]
MPPTLSWSAWRRRRKEKGAEQSNVPTDEGLPVGLSSTEDEVTPQIALLTISAVAAEIPPTSSRQPGPDAVPPTLAPPAPVGHAGQALHQSEPPRPYADSYDLWDEALASLTESERRNVDLFACNPDHNSASRKGLVVDIQEKIDTAFKGQQHDSTARRIIENSVSVLRKFANIGDIAVNFDPVHTALPWAAVRFVLVEPS